MVTTGQAAKGLGALGSAIGIPITTMGTGKIALGIANVNRGAQQLSESLDDPNGPSAKNLWGLAPFGQKYDDPLEPTAKEFWQERYDQFVTDPKTAAKKTVTEFFSLE
jgi:hypothetical protein